MRERVARLSDDEQEAALGMVELSCEQAPHEASRVMATHALPGLRVWPREPSTTTMYLEDEPRIGVLLPLGWREGLVLQSPRAGSTGWLAWWESERKFVWIPVLEWWPARR